MLNNRVMLLHRTSSSLEGHLVPNSQHTRTWMATQLHTLFLAGDSRKHRPRIHRHRGVAALLKMLMVRLHCHPRRLRRKLLVVLVARAMANRLVLAAYARWQNQWRCAYLHLVC